MYFCIKFYNMNIQIKLYLEPYLAQYYRYLNKSQPNQPIRLSFPTTANLHILSLFVHRQKFLQYKKEAAHFKEGRECITIEVQKQYLLGRRTRVFLPDHSQKIVEQFLRHHLLEFMQQQIAIWRDRSRSLKIEQDNKLQVAYLAKDVIIRNTLSVLGIDETMLDSETMRRAINRFGSTGNNRFTYAIEIPDTPEMQLQLFDKIKKSV